MLATIEQLPLHHEKPDGFGYALPMDGRDQVLVFHRGKDSISGNHYHRGAITSKAPEITYLASGKVELYLWDIKTSEKETHILEAGTLFRIEPNIFHAITALTDIIFLEFVIAGEDYEADTVRLSPCRECGLHYESPELAERCRAWCAEHKSCNLEYVRDALENKDI